MFMFLQEFLENFGKVGRSSEKKHVQILYNSRNERYYELNFYIVFSKIAYFKF